ncbi:hypothetical protein Ac42p023 [Acinetobacter phage Ac42]|uniref:hypothetical protein n=1 Tax=Acinetobacter phage Ac42 TaxID=762660 RepID=UPI0001EBCC79|nr:hypothetical protein Ac42p023 [Acinetobacter phage Ac42]ADI96261.1 hypothetical protein Ac42p023 [Acinetobacter phage Ac42]
MIVSLSGALTIKKLLQDRLEADHLRGRVQNTEVYMAWEHVSQQTEPVRVISLYLNEPINIEISDRYVKLIAKLAKETV